MEDRFSTPKLVRFGLQWKIYDMVAVKDINFRVPILDVGTGLPLGGYVLGGISGTDFLVSALGLTQPKAGRGIVLPSVFIHFWEDPTEIYCDNKSALCFSFIPIYRRCFFLLERRHY